MYDGYSLTLRCIAIQIVVVLSETNTHKIHPRLCVISQSAPRRGTGSVVVGLDLTCGARSGFIGTPLWGASGMGVVVVIDSVAKQRERQWE